MASINLSPILHLTITILITILTILPTTTHSETLYSQSATVSFSGTDYGSSTGWVYTTTIDAAEQWGRLYYRMDEIDASQYNNQYAHVTFMQIDNGAGSYAFNDGSTSTTTQSLRIVDSVGSTSLMQSSPTSSVQYLLNIDTGSYGELNVDTEYIYYYSTEWTCMEWYTNSDTQDIQLYEDGTLTYEVDGGIEFTIDSGTATFTIPQSADISIGMYTYNGVSVSGEFKEVEIGTERVGCDGTSTTGSGTNGNTDNTDNSDVDSDTDTDTNGNSNSDNSNSNESVSSSGSSSSSDSDEDVLWTIIILLLIILILIAFCVLMEAMGCLSCSFSGCVWLGMTGYNDKFSGNSKKGHHVNDASHTFAVSMANSQAIARVPSQDTNANHNARPATRPPQPVPVPVPKPASTYSGTSSYFPNGHNSIPPAVNGGSNAAGAGARPSKPPPIPPRPKGPPPVPRG